MPLQEHFYEGKNLMRSTFLKIILLSFFSFYPCTYPCTVHCDTLNGVTDNGSTWIMDQVLAVTILLQLQRLIEKNVQPAHWFNFRWTKPRNH